MLGDEVLRFRSDFAGFLRQSECSQRSPNLWERSKSGSRRFARSIPQLGSLGFLGSLGSLAPCPLNDMDEASNLGSVNKNGSDNSHSTFYINVDRKWQFCRLKMGQCAYKFFKLKPSIIASIGHLFQTRWVLTLCQKKNKFT